MKHQVSEGSDKNLKIINISVEEKPTGEIAAGAGIGTNGGSFGFSISENNWLGKGNRLKFELEVDGVFRGVLNYSIQTITFSEIQLIISFQVKVTTSQTKDMKTLFILQGYQLDLNNIKMFFNLGVSATFDDLRTQDQLQLP